MLNLCPFQTNVQIVVTYTRIQKNANWKRFPEQNQINLTSLR